MANYFGNLFFLDMKSVTLLVYSYIGTTVIVGVMDILTFKNKILLL